MTIDDRLLIPVADLPGPVPAGVPAVPPREEDRIPYYGPGAEWSRTYRRKMPITRGDLDATKAAEAKRARKAAKRLGVR